MRSAHRFLIFLLFPLLAPIGTVAGQNMTYASGSYTIRPLDVVRVTLYVADDQQFSTEVRVSSGGTVSLPYLDQVTLAGLTVEEARRFVYEPYNRDYYVEPHIDLVVLTSAARTVTVMGQVNAQGQVFLPSEQPLSLLQAIAAAGGFRSNDLADKRRVRITRIGTDGQEEVLTVNADDISATDMPLQENDLIFVPRRMW
ncbi:MAG: polysaccharide biosynthesis/export family protein [Opitutales bacterium]|nr:polysaccharide biosynthesis/export family protein [Opitutales bacterium]